MLLAVFFPDTFRRTARTLFKAKGPFIISGCVESDLGAVALTAEDIVLVSEESIRGNGDTCAEVHNLLI